MVDDPAGGWWRSAARRFRDEQKSGGWRRALAAMASDLWDLVRDSTPSRRRQRYGDVEFDWEFRVDTTAASLPGRARLAGAIAGGPYQPIPAEEFRESVGRLPIRYEEFTFLDLGSGKGRALLLAAEYPFRRIVGVELLPELHRVALENIAKHRGGAQNGKAIEAIRGDARDFEFPLDPLVVFLFNPFPRVIFATVLDRLAESLRQQSRPAWVVYHNPIHERVFRSRDWLERVTATPRFIVYRSAPQPNAR